MAHAWKACWVQALGGSNPPSSATGSRDSLEPRGFPLRAQGEPRPAQEGGAAAPLGRGAGLGRLLIVLHPGCGSARPGRRCGGPVPLGWRAHDARGPRPVGRRRPHGARGVSSVRFAIRRCSPGVEPRSGERVHWTAVLRVTVSSEPPQGRNAARIRVRCRVRGGSSYSHPGTPLLRPCLRGAPRASVRPCPDPVAACDARAAERRGPRPVPVRGTLGSARPSGAASGFCAAERHGPRPLPRTVSARGALRRPGRRRPPPRAVRPAAPPARRASRRAGPIRCSSTRWRSGSR